MTRSEFYEQKSKQRAADHADARRGRIRSKAIRTVSHGGGSIARTVVGSFDKVLEIGLAIILLFAMFSNAGAYAKMVGAADNGMITGVMTPVTALLAVEANTPAVDVVGKPSRNFADVQARGGVGWMTGTDPDTGTEVVKPLFFDLGGFITELQELDLDGEGDVFTRGIISLIKISGTLFKNVFVGNHFGSFNETADGVVDFVFNDSWLTMLDGFGGQVLKGIAKLFYGIFGGGS